LIILGNIYALKQFISCIQLVSASQRMVRFDLMEYRLKKEKSSSS
jgi:hypothetical protein